MRTERREDLANVPRPVAAFLVAIYFILLAVGILCSFVTTCCFLWKFFGKRVSIPSMSSTESTSDKESQRDEDPCEESAGSEYFEDTDEEYIRGPFYY